MCKWTRHVTRRGERVCDPELSIASFRRPLCRARLQNIVVGCYAESCATVATDLEPFVRTSDTACWPYVKSSAAPAVTLKQICDFLWSFDVHSASHAGTHLHRTKTIHLHCDATRGLRDNMDKIYASQQMRSYPNPNSSRIAPWTVLHPLKAPTNSLALTHVQFLRMSLHKAIPDLPRC
jgi:hypothetical protein